MTLEAASVDTKLKIFKGFFVTPDGELYSIKTGERKYTWLNKGRAAFYERTQFWIDGKKKNIYVHRLVAMLYLSEWDEALEVDHIDGDTLNNHVDNLRMRSTTDNQLDYQDRKDRVQAIKVLRSHPRCIFKEGVGGTNYKL